jgi:hypothetical protein
MANPPRYATPNFEMLSTWIGRPPEDDGPFWALNLMKYRAVAEYEDGRASVLSGKEADDAYSPRDSLAAVGAMIAFHCDVARQTLGDPTWDRIAIVRYPTRVAFFEMQQRDDFKEKHAHKEAGMDFTIVISCLPDRARPSVATPTGSQLVLRVAPADLPDIEGATRVATFDVEGVILGDERKFARVAFDAAPNSAVADALLAPSAVEFAVALAKPAIDRIDESLRLQA